MNKKLFGISALLALVLAGCNPTPAPTSESSSSADPSSGDTSSTSEPSSTSELPSAPELEDVFAAFMGLGTNHTAEIDGGVAKLNYVRNADYTYLEGFGGVAKITLPEEQGGEEGGEGAQQQGLAKKSLKASSFSDILHTEQAASMDKVNFTKIEKDPEPGEGEGQEGEGQGEETPVDDAKFFFVYEDEEGAYHEQWGAAFNSQAEYDKFSIVSLFEDFDEEFTPEDLAEAFVTYPGEEVYYVDTSLTNYFFGYMNLDFVQEYIGDAFISVGLTEEEAPFIDFYPTADSTEPAARMTFKANDLKHLAGLEAHLATLTEYPTSPISLEETLNAFMGHNYMGYTDASDLVGDEGSDFLYYATEQFNSLTWGEAWKVGSTNRAGLQQGVANVEMGKEIVGGLYSYAVTKDKDLAISMVNNPDTKAADYFDNTGKSMAWYDYAYTPEAALEFPSALAKAYESNGAFVIDDAAAVAKLAPCFRGLYMSCNFFVFGRGPYYVPEVGSIAISYELDEANNVEGILLTASIDFHVYDIDTYEVSEEVAIANVATVYDIFGEFGEVEKTETKVEKFLTEEVQTVAISENMPTSKVMDLNETFDIKGALAYTPERASVSFITEYELYDEEDPVVSIDENGVMTAIGIGETAVYSVIGGFVHELPVTVKGLKAYFGEEYVSEFKVAPQAEEASVFGFDIFGLADGTTFDIACDNANFTVAPKAYADGEEAPKDAKEYTVLASTSGEANITLTATEPDGGKAYTASVKVIALPSVEFVQENAYGTLSSGGYVYVDVIAPAGATIEVTSDNELIKPEYLADYSVVTFDPVENGEGAYEDACATLTITLTVGEDKYTDTCKVSVTSHTFVREWIYEAAATEAYDIILHEDGTAVATELYSEVTHVGTWTLKHVDATETSAAYDYAELNIAPFGSDNTTLKMVRGGNYDNVAALVTLTYEIPAAEEGADPTVKTLNGLAINAMNYGRVSQYRGQYAYSDAASVNYFGVVNVIILNNGTYYVFINGSLVKQAQLKSTTLYEVVSEDGLTKITIELYDYFDDPSDLTIAEFRYTRASAEDNWAVDYSGSAILAAKSALY